MDHALAEIKEMDRIQFLLDFEKRWIWRWSAVQDMTDMWGPIRNGGMKSKFFEDKKVWRKWLQAV